MMFFKNVLPLDVVCSNERSVQVNALVAQQKELFRIRPARRSDGEAIGSLLEELGYPNAADVGTVHWVSSHPEMEILVATDLRDRPIALLTLSHRPQLRMNGRIATIDELVVASAWRRRGVGQALVKRAVQRARVLSVKRLELVTHGAGEEVVRQFCAACGFQDAETRVMRSSELGCPSLVATSRAV
jgi:GNAT superfamily N-acetyltransferase